MGTEVDFLSVGEESKSGDALLLRYGDLHGHRDDQTVVVVDGGFSDDGKRVIDHMAIYYETDRADIVISTHPDGDHINGLKTVVENIQVDELWMHLPDEHSARVAEARASGFRLGYFSESVTMSLEASATLEEIARRRGIPIVEPFVGHSTGDGVITVLGPSLAFYEEQLENLRQVSGLAAALSVLESLAKSSRTFLSEDWWTEHLTDEGETSASNNTSVITLLDTGGFRALLTGDAGIPALSNAAVELVKHEIFPGDLVLVQVPHHGSRRSVGPTILNSLLGEIASPDLPSGTAVVSCARKGVPKHPSRQVSNAFLRRGYPVVATQGRSIWYQNDAPERAEYGPVEPLELFGEVEDPDA